MSDTKWIRELSDGGFLIDEETGIEYPNFYYDCTCSECGYNTGMQGQEFNFCPMCGCKIVGEEKE